MADHRNSTRFGIRYATAGSYNAAYCTDLSIIAQDGTPCSAGNEEDEVEAVRLPSIMDETRRLILGFGYDESLAQTANTYLDLTVCAGPEPATAVTDPAGLYFTRPQMGSLTKYSECTTAGGGADGSAGAPGDFVIVAADYNFTFIVLPIFGIQPR